MLNKKGHKAYKLTYHLVLVVKYRKNIFTQDCIVDKLKDKIIDISKDFNVIIIDQGIDKDHMHILFESQPTLDMTKYINILKGHSSRYVRKNFKNILEKELWGDSFWSDSYYLATTGNVSLSRLKAYVDQQENK